MENYWVSLELEKNIYSLIENTCLQQLLPHPFFVEQLIQPFAE
jgi:hypothetical protein